MNTVLFVNATIGFSENLFLDFFIFITFIFHIYIAPLQTKYFIRVERLKNK